MNTDPENNRNAFRALSHPELSTDHYSPAPWHVTPSGYAICNDDGVTIARGLNHDITDRRTIAANARLIAAAPELYETLQELIGIADNPDSNYTSEIMAEVTLTDAYNLVARIRGEAARA